MAKTKTRPWEAAEHLETGEDMALYLEAALDDGDPALVAAALGTSPAPRDSRGCQLAAGRMGRLPIKMAG